MPAVTLSNLNLISDIDVLRGLVTERDSIIANLSAQLESLKQHFLNLRRMHFGATSERLAAQAELFQEKVDVPVPPEEKIRVTYERQRRGRPALPKNLPRERVDYDLSETEKAEFDSVERIGEEISETLEYTPAKPAARTVNRRCARRLRNPRHYRRATPGLGCLRRSWYRRLPTICR